MTEPTCPANTGAPFLLQKERVSGAVGGRVLTMPSSQGATYEASKRASAGGAPTTAQSSLR